jgi:hypothetical protein
MPAHLAEAGYEGEKKGVRGRKAQSARQPRPKSYPAKPPSKGTTKKKTKKTKSSNESGMSLL